MESLLLLMLTRSTLPDRDAGNRRDCIVHLARGLGAAVLATALPVSVGAATATATTTPAAGKPGRLRIMVLGDSLSAEYGLPRGSGWVALLQARLDERQADVEVINASISGDTTAGGRTRLPALLRQHQPTHLIVELGANDALRGLPLAATKANLMAMLDAGKTTGCQLALLGMQLPPNYGGPYTRDFAALFGQVAKARAARLVPFLLAGVADVPDAERWFQADRIHPVAAAHPRLLDNVWPVVDDWLKARRR
jgi:acyl-CoA thioesterase-1